MKKTTFEALFKTNLHIIDGVLVGALVAVELVQVVGVPNVQMAVVITSDDVLVQETPQSFDRDRVVVLVFWQLAAANWTLAWRGSNVENVQRWGLLHLGTRGEN